MLHWTRALKRRQDPPAVTTDAAPPYYSPRRAYYSPRHAIGTRPRRARGLVKLPNPTYKGWQ